MANSDNLIKTTKIQNTYKRTQMQHKKEP